MYARYEAEGVGFVWYLQELQTHNDTLWMYVFYGNGFIIFIFHRTLLLLRIDINFLLELIIPTQNNDPPNSSIYRVISGMMGSSMFSIKSTIQFLHLDTIIISDKHQVLPMLHSGISQLNGLSWVQEQFHMKSGDFLFQLGSLSMVCEAM